MKKTLFVVVIMAAVAMMIGAQSVLAAKPTTPVTGIANGKITIFGGNVGGWPIPESTASGPWKVVVHDPMGTPIINLSATCQATDAVYKINYIGPGTLTMVDDEATIMIPSVKVKSKGNIWAWAICEIVINDTSMTLDITNNGVINARGNTNLFKAAPQD